jgi:DUF971 family protein
MSLQPVQIQKIGTEVAIAWSDGEETYLPLNTLRDACPCATCQGEPDITGKVIRPRNELTDTSYELSGWQIVGGYGVQPRWADGHSTGIFSYQYLRKLAT